MEKLSEKSEFVCPSSWAFVREQQFEVASGQRYAPSTLNVQSTLGLHRNPSFVQLESRSDGPQSKSQYQTVLDGRKDDPRELNDVDTDPASSVSIGEHVTEEMLIDGAQDSDDTDSDFSSPNSQPSSLDCLSMPISQPSYEDNQAVTPISGEDTEPNCQSSVEAQPRKENDIHVAVAGHPIQCEDKSTKPVVTLVVPKAVQAVVPSEPSTQKQPHLAKVLFASNKWKAEYPPNDRVTVEHDGEVYADTVYIKGHLAKVVKVDKVDHQVFNKWKQLDNNPHCSTVIAYLEDENSGYIIKECFENRITMVVNTIIKCQKTIKDDIERFDKSRHHCTADRMSQWRAKRKEQKRLSQLLEDLISSLINASERIHQCGYVLLNLQARNLFVKFDCDCWAKPTCTHESSGVTVVIAGCESAYPVGSIVGSSTNSKALNLLDSMHKYRRAEVVYDNLDLAIIIIKLLSKIIGNNTCNRKLKAWIFNLADAVFTDPPVEEIEQLFEKSGISHNVTSKIINYLKESTAHYTRLYGEHEV